MEGWHNVKWPRLLLNRDQRCGLCGTCTVRVIGWCHAKPWNNIVFGQSITCSNMNTRRLVNINPGRVEQALDVKNTPLRIIAEI